MYTQNFTGGGGGEIGRRKPRGGGGWSTFFPIGWRYWSYGRQPYFLKNITDMIASKTILGMILLYSPFQSI